MPDPAPKPSKLPRIIIAGVAAALVGVLVVAFFFVDFSSSQIEIATLVIGAIATIAGSLCAPANPGGPDPVLGVPDEFGYTPDPNKQHAMTQTEGGEDYGA